MPSKMCSECPFRPGSPYYHSHQAWARMLLAQREKHHGCHLIHMPDESNPAPENRCAGFEQWQAENVKPLLQAATACEAAEGELRAA